MNFVKSRDQKQLLLVMIKLLLYGQQHRGDWEWGISPGLILENKGGITKKGQESPVKGHN